MVQNVPPRPENGAEGPLASGNCEAASDSEKYEERSKDSRPKERKKGVSWTELEHKQFLKGLQKLGKGDWRGIAQQYVKTRTPTQVASHAQKHFIRRTNAQTHKRRASLFDMDSDEQGPSQRQCLEVATEHSTDTRSHGWAGPERQASTTSSMPFSSLPTPGQEPTGYQAFMQLQAAAAAGYALGSSYHNGRWDSKDGTARDGPAAYGISQQQAAHMAYMAYQHAAAAATMHSAYAADPTNTSQHFPPGVPPFPPGVLSYPYTSPYSFGGLPPPAYPFPAHADDKVRDNQANAQSEGSRKPKLLPGEHVGDSPASSGNASLAQFSADMPVGDSAASLGLSERAPMQASDPAAPPLKSTARPTSPLHAPKLFRPKATHAQPSSATQAGYGCEPLLRSLASISKPTPSHMTTATSEASGSGASNKSSLVRFDGGLVAAGGSYCDLSTPLAVTPSSRRVMSMLAPPN